MTDAMLPPDMGQDGPSGVLRIDPPLAEFFVAQGQTGPQPPPSELKLPAGIPFTITNVGSGSVPQVVLNIDNDEFEISRNDCGGALAVDKSCTVWVVFSPSSPGQQKGTLTAAPDDTGNGAASAELVGNGMVSTGGLLIEPAGYDYGAVGPNGGTKVFVVHNNSSNDFATVLLSIPPPQNESPSDFFIVENGCGQGLAANGSCGVQVNFVPQGTAIGRRTSVLNAHAQLATGAPAGDASAALLGSRATGNF
jgi:hypothetical protein